MTKIQELKDLLQESTHLAFFGGAGVSTESGIPDFRSANGIFQQATNRLVAPEEVLSKPFFATYPSEFFDFYFKYLVYEEAQPNTCHHFLASLENKGQRVSVITQNVDNLHEQAGSQEVYHLHGKSADNYCLQCGRHYDLADLHADDQGIPRCPEDNGIVRPNIVLYGETLPESDVTGAIQALQEADLLIVAGTSLMVYPAASFLGYYQGKQMVVINKSPITVPYSNALVFQTSLGEVIQALED
ncbi:NAD-dependent protein deacylase [Aerococcus kribbianus]|uniref:protein acetyllysine N-acetyltransferase n=1 Tax=Aerococcus kribbianus TaxID=2999064 RepID=A0A9X3FQW7_9LACT|nr:MULTISPECIES: NAD-dependent protein deacylase [unclassified Aerococcus]MCZ0718035.1 NAD-dependent protein deacylase [Aerococcus sp. YH-aer221]MCZ0726396.1 NAD-dependent protein deacylase [Aerococcus sp. YH-aer222]